ncbi:hypothetical protein C2G38_2191071 [Gigaspora rosea]|uniref:Uncharacterized protein n=1 Tax=Gigaspora rosea TaxID=44941 RepID=A0A397V330_9GLOM|nr:hypothetical protein C2G38_2191071 [Gigaspora rosea]
MKYVENPLRRKKSFTNKETLEEIEIGVTKTDNNFELVDAIRSMAKILYNREVIEKQKPVYNFDELCELLEKQDSNLNYFFNQLYLAARPSDRNSQTMEHSAGMSNEGLNTMANVGITMTARTVNRKKKKISETHEECVKDDLIEHFNNALIINIDDYHNIHVPHKPHTTATSSPTHMATLLANPCLTMAIPRNQVLNPKVVDGELIIKNIDKRFIINLGVLYYQYIKNCVKREYSDTELLEKLTLHSYDDSLKGINGYLDSLQTIYKQEPMQEYLSKFAIPVVADWPGQFYIRKAIAQKVLLHNQDIPDFVTAFLPIMGPLHVSLNYRELVFKKNYPLFNDIYKSVFGVRKDVVPLVLDVYAIHHREGNWLAYEEASMRCWSDLFLQFDRRNYKRAPLMFFSDIFYWEEINHPIVAIIINHLSFLSDCPVELFHSIIRRRTAKFSTGEQLRNVAHTIYQQRHSNDFQQQFVRSEKYPYSPKQLRMLSQKCAIHLLALFTKIYYAYNISSCVISSSDNINTYKLLSLGYEVTDRHLPRGFVTLRKPNISVLCDSTYCNTPYDSVNSSILACGHGYHSYCLQNQQFNCLDYLQNEVRKNTNALIKSLTKSLGENLPKEDTDNDDEDSDEIHEISDEVAVELQLEQVKKTLYFRKTILDFFLKKRFLQINKKEKKKFELHLQETQDSHSTRLQEICQQDNIQTNVPNEYIVGVKVNNVDLFAKTQYTSFEEVVYTIIWDSCNEKKEIIADQYGIGEQFHIA